MDKLKKEKIKMNTKKQKTIKQEKKIRPDKKDN